MQFGLARFWLVYAFEDGGFAYCAAIVCGGGTIRKLFATEEKRLDERRGFVAAWADGRRNASIYILRLAIELSLHSLNGGYGDTASGPAPARVRYANDMLNGIVKDDGYAIGKRERDGHIAQIGNDCVSLAPRLRGPD